MATGDRIQRIIDSSDRALLGVEESTIKRIEAALDASYRRLERDFLGAYTKYGSNTSLLPQQRRLLIMDEIKQLSALITPSQATTLQADFEEMLKASGELGVAAASDLSSAISNTTLENFATVPIEALKFQAQDGVRRLMGHGEAFASNASAIVEQGLVQGWGAKKTASQLRQQLGVTKGKAEAIARTETISSFSQAATANYKRNEINYFQSIPTRDSRTCPICVGRAGNVYEIGKASIPWHVRCRCFPSPWKPEWQELGLIDNKWLEDYAAESEAMLAVTGKKPDRGIAPFERASGGEAAKPVWTVRGGSALPPKTSYTTPASVRGWNNRFVNESAEHAAIFDLNGNLLLEKTSGSASAVEFTADEIGRMKGAVLTHNHPLDPNLSRRGSSFSQDDFAIAMRGELGEFMAVSGDYEYSLRAGANGWSRQRWESEGVAVYDRIANEEIARVREWKATQMAKGVSPDELIHEMNFRVWHTISQRVSDELGLEYRRIKRVS